MIYKIIGSINKECDICKKIKCNVIFDTQSNINLMVRCKKHIPKELEEIKCMYQNDSCFECPDKKSC